MEGLDAVLRFEKTVLGLEEVPAAEGGDARRQGAAEPVDEVKIVTAFFEDVGSGEFAVPPPVSHDVAAVSGRDVLVGVD